MQSDSTRVCGIHEEGQDIGMCVVCVCVCVCVCGGGGGFITYHCLIDDPL